jgi:hypothetical protein
MGSADTEYSCWIEKGKEKGAAKLLVMYDMEI